MTSRSAIAATALAFILLPSPFRIAAQDPAPTAEPQSGDAQAAEIKRLCDARLQTLGTTLTATDDVLDAMEAVVGAVEQEARKEPELAAAAVSAPPAVAIQAATTARDSVKLNVDLAKGYRAQAAETLALAQRTTDPVVKLSHYKQALDFLEKGQSLARRAADDLAPRVHRSHTVNSEAFEKLKTLSSALEHGTPGTAIGTLRQGFDGAVARLDEAVAPAGTRAFSGSLRAYSNGSVTLDNGRRIDVSAIERAAAAGGAAGAPQARQPLFKPVPLPEGTSYMVDPAVLNRAREASPGVGGVSLDVTFVALGAAGVPGFASGGPLEGVEATVMISLQRLQRRAQPYAADPARWAALPDDLRFPGGIGRIFGYVLDPARNDIVLIGSPAARPQARLDIDTIVLGLRACWRDEITPFVSLDASPLEPFGPQLSRVGGVPDDSVAAKVMLDADYLMKAIMLGTRPTGVASFQSVVDLVRRAPASMSRPWHARFWFYPKPLGAGALTVSASRRTVTFNTELQVLTEQMATQGAMFLGESAEGVEDTAARGFTSAMETFAASTSTDPDALLLRLRGLSDVATLGTVLRKEGVHYPVLGQIAALPYRRLEGTAAVPRQYPGLVADIDVRAGGRLTRITIGGGVELVPRPRRTRLSDSEFLAAHFERRVDAGDAQARDVVREAIPAVLARTTAGDQRVDAHLTKGSDAFRRGDFEAAAREFRAATALEPASADAYVNLAFSLSRLGRVSGARAAIRTARLLEPGDAAARLIDLAIEAKAGRPWSDIESSSKARRDLVRLYTTNAGRALTRNGEQAFAWADDAIALESGEPSAEAYYLRGSARMARAPEQACGDITRAWSETEYVQSGAAYDDDARIHALASLAMAECAIGRSSRGLETGDPGPTLFRALADRMQEVIDLLGPAQKLYPDLSTLFSAGLRVEGVRHGFRELMYTDEGRRREVARLDALGEDLLRRFPEAGDVYEAVGQLQLDLGAPERAAAVCTTRLAARPGDTACLTIRGDARARTGRCADARADLTKARQDPDFRAPAEFVARCGPL